jgi:hypothetical protein
MTVGSGVFGVKNGGWEFDWCEVTFVFGLKMGVKGCVKVFQRVNSYKKNVLSGPLGHLLRYEHASGPRSTAVHLRPGDGSLASAARLRAQNSR